jgi:FAD/FMN-containing dehydrogenase
VRVSGGATLGDLDREAQKYGLVLPAGVVTNSVVAGLTLGGDLGYLRNKYGLTCGTSQLSYFKLSSCLAD